MGHQLWVVWNWPNGIVVGNLLAALIQIVVVALVVFLLRNVLGPILVRWLHKHHAEHLETIARKATYQHDSELP